VIQPKRSLELQAAMAPNFIAQAWPSARDQALAACPQLPKTVRSILICGCGDSHHAAVSLELPLAASTGLPVRAANSLIAGRYLLPRDVHDPQSVMLIAISASGEVARTLEAAELARGCGAHTLAITTQAASALAGAAEGRLALSLPELPVGPGLLSYLASLLLGYALAETWSKEKVRGRLAGAITELPGRLEAWLAGEAGVGRALAEDLDPARPIVFLGSGPAFGSAMFAAAKTIEAAGALAWAQDVEEWAHVEYFSNPADQTLWLLSPGGRSADRESEVLAAAQAIGRRVQISRWLTPESEDSLLREAVAPLALWAGPAAFAERLAERLGELPFRGFAGGRDRREGGGPSRIRSSPRWKNFDRPAGWEA
jgi:glucosamine--fructose-6-phosphate aminotransferase (isomerizing)